VAAGRSPSCNFISAPHRQIGSSVEPGSNNRSMTKLSSNKFYGEACTVAVAFISTVMAIPMVATAKKAKIAHTRIEV
jgi:hypothetical protein